MLDASKFLVLDLDKKRNITHELASCEETRNGYQVIYKKTMAKTYRYTFNRMIKLSYLERIDLCSHRLKFRSDLLRDVNEASKVLDRHSRVLWFIQNKNEARLYDEKDIVVEEIFEPKKSRNDIWEYLCSIAKLNTLKNDKGEPLLSKQYSKVQSLSEDRAIMPYLMPQRKFSKIDTSPFLIHPLKCNKSQLKALESAFTEQISVIEGPPGTGKTQTIVQILLNIVFQNKTALVVSNNNEATQNVLTELKKLNLGFLVAPLGSKENKTTFIKDYQKQNLVPSEIASWHLSGDWEQKKNKLELLTRKLRELLDLIEKKALLENELSHLRLDRQHFDLEYPISIFEKQSSSPFLQIRRFVPYKSEILTLPFELRRNFENCDNQAKFKEAFLSFLVRLKCYCLIKMPWEFYRQPTHTIIGIFMRWFFLMKEKALCEAIEEVSALIESHQKEKIENQVVKLSTEFLRDSLASKYQKQRPTFSESDLNPSGFLFREFCSWYPIVLSTTFSARNTGYEFDYLIMDEASQVSIDTGSLSLSCAANAVIVGDNKQLRNVISNQTQQELQQEYEKYEIADGYNAAKYNFLESIVNVIPNVSRTLLREHYRCHPKIINFCNQKFYNGKLIIMSKDQGEDNVLFAIQTVKGSHAIDHRNQRESDVIGKEVLSHLDKSDTLVIAPYRAQCELLEQHDVEKVLTVHKCQGQGFNTVIFSTVDNEITPFTDCSNLVNVAVSRAKKCFCLVTTGNEQKLNGNISDLQKYIAYNNFEVRRSKLKSIFDYLYKAYSEERSSFLAKHPKISKFDSEKVLQVFTGK